MVSFQCEKCGDILTKKKLDAHWNRCRDTSFTCIDCMTQFWGYDYQGHTSCISEAQKYQGVLYKEKKPKGQAQAQTGKSNQQQQPSSKMLPKAAYVEDVPDSPASSFVAKSTPSVPPPAPTPPAADTPSASQSKEKVNVFDYLEQSASSHSSSISSVESDRKTSKAAAMTRTQSKKLAAKSDAEDSYSYGNTPVEKLGRSYNSDIDVDMSDAPAAVVNEKAGIKTPAAQIDLVGGDNQSDKKKRKRGVDKIEVDDMDRRVLHSGLTGGLDKLLSNHETPEQAQASPLGPQKRSKRTKEDELVTKSLVVKSKEKETRKEEKRHDKSKDLKKFEYDSHKYSSKDKDLIKHSNNKKLTSTWSLKQLPEQSHSEFFIGLVDKDYTSRKGQSIWGTLKTFHEGLIGNGVEEGEGGFVGVLGEEEKRLFKGLRMRKNKQGEIVLFARPGSEFD